MRNMEIKQTVKEICELTYHDKINYLIQFVKINQLNYKLYPYSFGTNLEVVIKGKNQGKEIIFFAHYDVFNESIEGANDNSSSVAVLMFTAIHLDQNPPLYTVKIIFNDNEEILGGIYGKNSTIDQISRIMENVGSYQYLKTADHQKVIAAFVLELCGIGDSLYIAESSAKIKCDPGLNFFLTAVAEQNQYKLLKIPIAASDLISLHLTGYSGTVLGAIPYIEGKNYLMDLGRDGFSKNIYPHVWKKNHTSLDKYFSIQEKSLNMVFQFVLTVINNVSQLDK
jgi:hypothetical protein